MAKQLYIKLQTPTIELNISATDASMAKATLTIGFKRYSINDTDLQLDKLQLVLNDHLTLLQDRQASIDSNVTAEQIAKANAAIVEFMKSNIVYLKKAKLDLYDEDTKQTSELIIKDTREAKPLEDFWETPDACLDALLDMYLSSTPWKSSFTTALQNALLNSNLEEGKLKN